MITPKNAVLSKMLERLFASMVSGPAMNCRPHASRQRVDFAQLVRLRDAEPSASLLNVLGDDQQAKIAARVPAPAKAAVLGQAKAGAADDEEEQTDESSEERAARKAWSEQQSILSKLRVIADDARTYEQDTGVHVLDIGFPLLSLPPGSFGGRAGLSTRRILAPIAFIPVSLTVKTGAKQVIEIACRGEGVDRVKPNVALLAWLEQQTGQPMMDLFADDTGEEPWREIAGLVQAVAARVELELPELFSQTAMPESIELMATPKADDDATGKAIVCSAVLGLFPTSNQGLLRDVREMVAEGVADGPIESFVRLGTSLDVSPTDAGPDAGPRPSADAPIISRQFATERLVSRADPCQTRAVRLAQSRRGLVIHGPPGTGKSQTIANIIGDHLARGERVLFVCDKRTALDVVADRLQALGIGELCATVHDPQRDQREFYKSVREQLDNLADAPLKPGASEKLAKVDAELQTLHDDLTRYYTALMGKTRGGPGSFHHLVGQWLAESGSVGNVIDERALHQVPAADFDRHAQRLREVLERGEAVGYADNPWVGRAGVDLADFLALPMHVVKSGISTCVEAADVVGDGLDPFAVAFGPDEDLAVESARRVALADELEALPELPPASAKHWTSKTREAVAQALAQLKQIQSTLALVSQESLDQDLVNRAAAMKPAEAIAPDAAALDAYAKAFREKSANVAHALHAAGPSGTGVVLKWMTAPETKTSAARKRLQGAVLIAEAVEASSLDASLLARFDASPVAMPKVTEWLAALNAYLDGAAKWYAFLQFGAKKAALPAVQFFGLSLNAASAGSVKQFLTDLQKREDLRSAVEGATGDKFDGRPDDGDLVGTFRQHRSVLDALAASPPEGDANFALSEEVRAAVNQLVEPQLTPVQATLDRYGLAARADDAARLATFVQALKRRALIAQTLNKHALPSPLLWPLPSDSTLIDAHRVHLTLLQFLEKWPGGTPLGDMVAKALTEQESRSNILADLRSAPDRAARLVRLERALSDAGLLNEGTKRELMTSARAGRTVGEQVGRFADSVETLEGVLRVGEGLSNLPSTLAEPARLMLAKRCSAKDAYSTVRRNVLAGEIAKRLRNNPELQSVDGHRLQSSFERYRSLSEKKKELVKDDIVHRWTERQKSRLLASTG